LILKGREALHGGITEGGAMPEGRAANRHAEVGKRLAGLFSSAAPWRHCVQDDQSGGISRKSDQFSACRHRFQIVDLRTARDNHEVCPPGSFQRGGLGTSRGVDDHEIDASLLGRL